MGREVRRVPPHWAHPNRDAEHDRYGHGGYQPMYDRGFDEAFAEWLAGFDRVRSGKLTDTERECYPRGLADWLFDETPPDPTYYRPWTDDEATWFQVWETVSEGTPVTPPFATRAELVDYLVAHGDFWDEKRGNKGWGRDNAERFVNTGWAPSGIVVRHADGTATIQAPRDM